jgi:DNA-binding winged helix-turn-helix (wHTH) protein/tetratricopeptide (TPR) repeat protein
MKVGRIADGLPMTRREATLADVEPFALGGLSVAPALRTVRDAQGRETMIEPRVMQCLVALSERSGSVVSRDELLRTCWGGATVGDDAVNRCISRLRALGAVTGAFSIDTIARVGFRLRPSAPPDEAAAQDQSACVLAVLPLDDLSPGQEFSRFARELAGEFVHRLSSAPGMRLVARERSATHVLNGYVRHDGDCVRAMLRLAAQAGEAVIWSDRYDITLADSAGAVDEIAAAVTHAVRCRLDPAVRCGSVDAVAYDLFLRTRRRPDRLGTQSLKANIAALQDVVTRAPAFAEAWGALAYAHALLASFAAPEDRAGLRASAKDFAMRALALDAQCATAAVALAVAYPAHEDIREHMHWLKQALMWQPEDAPTVRLYSRALASVGRNAEALVQARRAAALEPLDPHIAAMLGRTLCENGEYQEAEAVLQRALKRWPHFELISVWLCVVLIAMDNRAGAAALVASREMGAYQADIDELLSDQTGSLALAALRRAKQEGASVALAPLVRAAQAGHTEEALRIALTCGIGGGGLPNTRGTSGNNLSLLFSAWQPQIRRHPLFVSLCDRLGLVAYWVETGAWPDCASDAALPYDFRKTAEALAGRGREKPLRKPA